MTAAAIKAVYADYRRVKSRKVHQVVFEIDSALWPDAYRVLGEPNIDISQWFAIAKMNAAEPAPTPQQQGSNLAANAALMLKDTLFQRFMAETRTRHGVPPEGNVDEALKDHLNIASKSELNTNPAAAARWRDLRAEFDAWTRT